MLPVVTIMRKYWRLPKHDRLLLLEATILLAVAAMAIGILPFRLVGRLAALLPSRQKPSRDMSEAIVQRIRWALGSCASRVPWRAMCFQQGLAAQLMLRRRGIPSVLYYGAAPDDQRGLSAHVWVRFDDIEVVGGDIASRFAVLTTFPIETDTR